MPVDAKLAFRRPAEAPEAPAARHGAPQEQPGRPHLPSDVPAAKREAPPGQPERPIEKTSAPQKVQSPPRPWIRWALFAVLPIGLIG